MTARETDEPARLGTLESQVMDVLWTCGGCTIRNVIDRLDGRPAYTTIATVLGNLERKGFVEHVREGRSARYLPASTRSEHAAEVMEHALAASGDRAASILHFVEAMPESDRALLRDYLDGPGGRSARGTP
ncbi:BlaI/MecI/CopY family transcriptional regulator [Isoptericola haloaureus]|uniref:BlaI/MecI/CopY family transcriptional regulator n=1 Tax=Isoptericola haloaureus TaxID=1542902 RepID=A0ABU7ZB48_9MICO